MPRPIGSRDTNEDVLVDALAVHGLTIYKVEVLTPGIPDLQAICKGKIYPIELKYNKKQTEPKPTAIRSGCLLRCLAILGTRCLPCSGNQETCSRRKKRLVWDSWLLRIRSRSNRQCFCPAIHWECRGRHRCYNP